MLDFRRSERSLYRDANGCITGRVSAGVPPDTIRRDANGCIKWLHQIARERAYACGPFNVDANGSINMDGRLV